MDYRKEQLELMRRRIDNLPGRIEEEREFVHIWGAYLEPVRNYFKWLRGYKHYPRNPDFVAKKGDEVFIVEVKSQSKGKFW